VTVREPSHIHLLSAKAWPYVVVMSLVVALLIVGLWNHLALQAPLGRVLASDERNAGIEARAHFGSYIRPHVLVFDLRRVAEGTREVDTFRVLLQFAAALQDRRFETVRMAHRGTTKLVLDGDYFQRMGREYGDKNPLLFVAGFPRYLRRPNGERVFPQGAHGREDRPYRQLADFWEVYQVWYLTERTPPP